MVDTTMITRALHAYDHTPGSRTTKIEAALTAAGLYRPALPSFQLALEIWDEENPDRQDGATAIRRREQRALFATWWFIENVSQDAPDRSDVFFEVRELVRAAR